MVGISSLIIFLCCCENALLEFDIVPNSNSNVVVVLESTESNTHTISIFRRKKKKVKDSKKAKKRNRSMGKTLKRKNEDTLRR
jgi:hypothetical protein